MTLDLASITRQIATMAAQTAWLDQGEGLSQALALFTASDAAALRARIDEARTSWLVARLPGTLLELTECGALPACPPAWTVLATDGSSITPERHSPIHFFVFNVSQVRLTYGPAPSASIEHQPRLCFRPEETHLTLSGGVRRLPIDGARLAASRAVAELRALADLVDSRRAAEPALAGLPTVALQDGSLILWSIETEEPRVRELLLTDYLDAADRLRQADVPLAAYISAPASTDVINALKVAACPHVPIDFERISCDQCPSRQRPSGPACGIVPVPPLTDRWLFEQWLAPGERSALFISQSKILQHYTARHDDFQIYFFYLHTGQEVARIEVPRWVVEQPDLLDLVHATIYDQSRRGQGYPTALQEAHEAAVIHADERRLVERLIDEAMARIGLTMRRSGKDTSKRIRAL